LVSSRVAVRVDRCTLAVTTTLRAMGRAVRGREENPREAVLALEAGAESGGAVEAFPAMGVRPAAALVEGVRAAPAAAVRQRVARQPFRAGPSIASPSRT
jgi:hypothetical protein